MSHTLFSPLMPYFSCFSTPGKGEEEAFFEGTRVIFQSEVLTPQPRPMRENNLMKYFEVWILSALFSIHAISFY